MTHTEDTKSFPTVSAATLTTFMWMIKSQTHRKGMYCTLDFEQLQVSVQVLSFLFHSSRQVFRLTQISWRLVWVLSVTHHTWVPHCDFTCKFKHFFLWNICNRDKMILFLSSKNLSYGKNYTSFWLRTQLIKHNTAHYFSETSTLAVKILNHEELFLTWQWDADAMKSIQYSKYTKLATT